MARSHFPFDLTFKIGEAPCEIADDVDLGPQRHLTRRFGEFRIEQPCPMLGCPCHACLALFVAQQD